MAVEQHPVELIQTRGLISNLTTPAFLVDNEGNLVFFNDAAGELLGLRFEEAGPMDSQEWGTRFEPTQPDGSPVAVEELALSYALSARRPAHQRLRIRSVAGLDEQIEVCAFPITGTGGTHGALAIFWLLDDEAE